MRHILSLCLFLPRWLYQSDEQQTPCPNNLISLAMCSLWSGFNWNYMISVSPPLRSSSCLSDACPMDLWSSFLFHFYFNLPSYLCPGRPNKFDLCLCVSKHVRRRRSVSRSVVEVGRLDTQHDSFIQHYLVLLTWRNVIVWSILSFGCWLWMKSSTIRFNCSKISTRTMFSQGCWCIVSN